jgi:hypothetical protein
MVYLSSQFQMISSSSWPILIIVIKPETNGTTELLHFRRPPRLCLTFYLNTEKFSNFPTSDTIQYFRILYHVPSTTRTSEIRASTMLPSTRN